MHMDVSHSHICRRTSRRWTWGVHPRGLAEVGRTRCSDIQRPLRTTPVYLLPSFPLTSRRRASSNRASIGRKASKILSLKYRIGTLRTFRVSVPSADRVGQPLPIPTSPQSSGRYQIQISEAEVHRALLNLWCFAGAYASASPHIVSLAERGSTVTTPRRYLRR